MTHMTLIVEVLGTVSALVVAGVTLESIRRRLAGADLEVDLLRAATWERAVRYRTPVRQTPVVDLRSRAAGRRGDLANTA